MIISECILLSIEIIKVPCATLTVLVKNTIKHMKTYQAVGSLWRHPRWFQPVVELCTFLAQRHFVLFGDIILNELAIVHSGFKTCLLEAFVFVYVVYVFYLYNALNDYHNQSPFYFTYVDK